MIYHAICVLPHTFKSMTPLPAASTRETLAPIVKHTLRALFYVAPSYCFFDVCFIARCQQGSGHHARDRHIQAPDTKQVPGTTQRGAAMATNALTIPVRGRDLRVIPAERELRPKWVYEDGKRTDKPAVDDKGRPLYGITALIDSDFTGPVDGCRITVATPNLPPVAFGQILHLTDDAVIKVMNNSKGFELLISVQASGFVSDKAA